MKLGKRYNYSIVMNKKIIGYILFGLSFCMWLVPTFIGFLHLPAKQVAIWITTAIVLGEVFFLLSIVLLGKAFLRRLKYCLKKSWYWILFKLGKQKK
jgi:hypothetical protein